MVTTAKMFMPDLQRIRIVFNAQESRSLDERLDLIENIKVIAPKIYRYRCANCGRINNGQCRACKEETKNESLI